MNRSIATLACLVLLVLESALPLGAQEDRWKELNDQVAQLYHEEKYDEALPQAQEAVRVAEATFGREHLNVGLSVGRLGLVYQRLGKFAEAEPLLQRALSIYEKVRGPEDPEVATCLNNLAELYDDEGKYAEAEPLFLRALAIDEKALGPEHPDLAPDLNNLASLYQDQGKFAEAEQLYRRALAINEKSLGADHPILARSLNNLASLYKDQGKYADAEPLYRRALAIKEKALGPDDPDVAASLNNLALLCEEEGKYAEAEPLLHRAVAIDEKALGPEHPDLAPDLNNLASLYQDQGKYAEAESLYRRALAIREKSLGPTHPDVAISLNNLAELCYTEGKYVEALRLHRRALDIREATLGPDHPDVAQSVNNIAAIFSDQGEYAEAEPIQRRALAIEEKALGAEHPAVAKMLNNLAEMCQNQGKYAEAERLYRRALAIDENLFGPDHPGVATDLSNLAMLYDAQGKFAEAEPIFDRSLGSLTKQFEYSFTYMSEKERLGFLATLAYRFPVYFSFVFTFREQDPSLVGKMYDVLLWEKGFIAASAASLRAKILASGDQESLALLDKLTAKKTQFAGLASSPPQVDKDGWRKTIERLEQESNDLERELVKRSAALAEEKTLAHSTWRDVQKGLKPGEAAVEIVRFNFFDGKKWTDTNYYVALVVTPETTTGPKFIVLGESQKLEAAPLASFRAHVGRTRGVVAEEASAEQESAGAAVAYDAFWKSLEPEIGRAKRVFVSPDGILNQIPLGLLANSSGELLLEKYELRVVNSTKDLLRPQHNASSKTAVLLGNPKFDLTEPEQRAALEKLNVGEQNRPLLAWAAVADTGLRSRDERGGKLNPLPATQIEIDAVGKLLKDAGWQIASYTGERALEEVLDRARSPRVVHVATHGFFLSDQEVARRTKTSGDKPSGLEDPMLRSGLYFAGADRAESGAPPAAGLEDGVLTAYEATQLNLQGTELVVLSACETGLGEQQNGEGVFGLRRAFQEAGAESVLMSMWSVPDKETQELMVLFYQKWLGGLDKHEALRQAQLKERETVRQRYGKDLPYYWGAFVLVGR